jgi:hypothetical protein
MPSFRLRQSLTGDSPERDQKPHSVLSAVFAFDKVDAHPVNAITVCCSSIVLVREAQQQTPHGQDQHPILVCAFLLEHLQGSCFASIFLKQKKEYLGLRRGRLCSPYVTKSQNISPIGSCPGISQTVLVMLRSCGLVTSQDHTTQTTQNNKPQAPRARKSLAKA